MITAIQAMYKTRNTGTGTECGECRQTFWGMFPNMPGNVAKHSGKCPQTFQRMPSNIPGNVAKLSSTRSIT